LIKLNFHKNEEGKYHCPVTYKEFNEFSHIVAVRETGNVYSNDAYIQLNKEPKFYFDLLTSNTNLVFILIFIDEKFDPKKVITI
jgi:peptidyl-prolyl cis-trans isomerase-like protein 2